MARTRHAHNKINYNSVNNICGIKFLRELPQRTLPSGSKNRFGLFVCSFCGNEFSARISYIRSGHTKGCGCHRGKYVHGLYKHRLYVIWADMKQRCYNINNTSYKNYGARGVKICSDWKNNFMCFYTWAINNGYDNALTVDRINCAGDYCPENCRFSTKTIQSRNKRQIPNKVPGIRFLEKLNKWYARIKVNRKEIYLGVYSAKEEAIMARNQYIINNNLIGFNLY